MPSLPKHHLLELPPNVIQEIRKIHGLDKPGRIDEAIDILEQWLEKQDHIIKKVFDRGYMERTLIACKGSVEKAKKQIDRLCTIKTLLPHFFTITNIKVQLQHMQEIAFIVPLPKLTKDLYRISLIKVNDKQLTEKHFTEFHQYNIVLCEYLKAHDYVNGFIVVLDYEESNVLEMITKTNTVELQQFLRIIIEGFGARLKGLHALTQSKFVDLGLKMVKPLMSQKIANRIHVHKTLEELHSMVPKDLLPAEYGGKEKSIAELNADWITELSSKEHVEYMKIMNKACTDEKLRNLEKFNEEYMGMAGAFRNLNVD